MIKWVKQNGSEIETNERKETVKYCESLGWKRKDEQQQQAKRGRPSKQHSD